MTSIRVQLGARSYDIVVTTKDTAGVGSFARARLRGSLVLIVTDEHVVEHAERVRRTLEAAEFRAALAVLAAGEGQKSQAGASTLYDRLVELQADRRAAVVAVGGGVVGDLAGFVAATYNRGLPLLMVPTTLLAMVDSAVGGKVAINHPRGKNLIGAFHQPAGVWMDTEVLSTLPDREYRSGLAEVVKYGAALDADFFAWQERHVREVLAREPTALRHLIERCCHLKARIVEKDEHEETGLRAVLNFGHTFAHAFETVGGYGTWLHGEAVAAGLICASRLAQNRGLVGSEVTVRQLRLLEAFALPTAPPSWSATELLAAMRLDKKAVAGRLRLVLPCRLGEAVIVEDVSDEEVQAVLCSSTSDGRPLG
jgi:3-dehydroquinate synthase